MLELVSKETREIIENKKGYRSEALYGEGYRDIREVCIHETFELENTDIPCTILKLYKDYLSVDNVYFLGKIMSYCEVSEEEKEMFGDICLAIAKKITGEDNISCLWLCNNKENVKEYLVPFDEELDDSCIEEYILPDNICILSDIGLEGALIAYKF